MTAEHIAPNGLCEAVNARLEAGEDGAAQSLIRFCGVMASLDGVDAQQECPARPYIGETDFSTMTFDQGEQDA